ncbi:MAG TPA: demethylmenaquinone methyltransferase [Streptosporangiaceae bacterium]|jgi:demethylmenaquinone methyltransferase/2-methoxy-6-polyprenyl-1,4-benzoquinol methylase
MARADLEKRPGEVAAMFDQLAGRYDLLNDLLSAGQVRLWRRVVARAVGARPGERILDLAAGTGTSTVSFAASGAECVACDFSIGMLRAGIGRVRSDASGPQPAFVGGDALRLPFADGVFDGVTISFGLRNVVDPQGALAEMLRVTRPGGRLVICEFSRISNRPLRVLYERYLARALPAVARRVSRNPAAYEYLAESIVDWPDQPGLARLLHEAGWSAVKWQNLTLGIVAVHLARRPA